MTTGGDVLLATEDGEGTLVLTLNRPESLNALSPDLVMRLTDELHRLVHDNGRRVVVLTGRGRAFCSGVDLGESFPVGFEGSPQRRWTDVQRWFSDLVVLLRRLPQVVIAAVNGPCVGGGFSLAMAADIRFAHHSAYFLGAPINIGQSASEMGASYLLPRIIGGRAAEILLTGRRVLADEADRIGLVTGVSDEVMHTALQTARLLAAKAPLALRLSKEALIAAQSAGSLEAAITMEDRTQVLGVLTEDLQEGQRAFLEKREPHYRG